MSFQMYVPTRIIFGNGNLKELHKQTMPGKKVLLVISNGRATKVNGYLDRTLEELRMAGVETVVFDQIEANPLDATVMLGALEARKQHCDFIVALGGGSVMDASKAIATMATNKGDVWDYISGGSGKALSIETAPLPIIAITTTAGTGSEVDQWGVISKLETNEKIGFGGIDELFPVIAIIDPELMTTVPAKLTAYQGFDALFHSIECYISNMASDMSDMYALTAIELIGQYLARAVSNGKDLIAREKVALANTLSGVVMTVSCTTSEHSLEHAMSAYHHDLPHGAGLLMISKAYFQHFIDQHVCDDRFLTMAKALGKADAREAQDFITALSDLQKACQVDTLAMSEYGIKRSEFRDFAKNAKSTMGGLFLADPCALSEDDCVAIYEASYQ